jgi:hypothetical protein
MPKGEHVSRSHPAIQGWGGASVGRKGCKTTNLEQAVEVIQDGSFRRRAILSRDLVHPGHHYRNWRRASENERKNGREVCLAVSLYDVRLEIVCWRPHLVTASVHLCCRSTPRVHHHPTTVRSLKPKTSTEESRQRERRSKHDLNITVSLLSSPLHNKCFFCFFQKLAF